MIPVAGYWFGEPWPEVSLVRSVVAYDDGDPFTAFRIDEPISGISLLRNAADPNAPKRKRVRRRRHPGVEFAVDGANGENIFRTFDEAISFATGLSLSNGRPVHVDVLVHTPAGAKWWRPDEGVEDFKSDPEASVFERIEIRADSHGIIH